MFCLLIQTGCIAHAAADELVTATTMCTEAGRHSLMRRPALVFTATDCLLAPQLVVLQDDTLAQVKRGNNSSSNSSSNKHKQQERKQWYSSRKSRSNTISHNSFT